MCFSVSAGSPSQEQLPGTSRHSVIWYIQPPRAALSSKAWLYSPHQIPRAVSFWGSSGITALQMTGLLENKSLHSPPALRLPQDKPYPSPGLEISEECHSGGFQGPQHRIDGERTRGKAEGNHSSKTIALRFYSELL